MLSHGMNRETYLKEAWKAYPRAPENAVSLRTYLRLLEKQQAPDPRWVGGALESPEAEGFTLSGQGVQIFVQVSEDIGFQNFLRVGDKLLVHVDRKQLHRNKDGSWAFRNISRIYLSAPALQTPASTGASAPLVSQWHTFVDHVEKHLESRGLQQVSTPSLVKAGGFEPSLDPIPVGDSLFLPTSPEFHLKKLLARGWTDFFEICRSYREEQVGAHHQREFWMLEWYRAFRGPEQLVEDLQLLLRFLQQKNFICSTEGIEIKQASMEDLFARHLNFKLRPDTTSQQLRELADQVFGEYIFDESWDDLFHRIFINEIEPKLVAEGPLIIRDYPPCQAALARVNDRGWAERFEFYWYGMEIANAFHEVNSPEVQEQRLKSAREERRSQGKCSMGYDPEFEGALLEGIPACSGIALGLERLFMACQKLTDIKALRLFPEF